MNAIVEKATALKSGIKARAAEIEKARRLPADLAATLAKAGCFDLVCRARLAD